MTIKGNDIIITNNTGMAVASAKSCEIHIDCETQEVCGNGSWRQFIARRKSWSVNISHIVTSVKNSINMVGTSLTIHIGKVTDGSRTLSADKVSGSIIVTGWKCTATRGSLASGSFTFQGTGALL